MRSGYILAGALILMTVNGAHAEGWWCGFASHVKSAEKSPMECGYSSATECESAIGKGGVCFVDPAFALNMKRVRPISMTGLSASTK
jgi:hypothetical protein